MISLILLKLFTFSQILQGVPKLSHATVYIYNEYNYFCTNTTTTIIILVSDIII